MHKILIVMATTLSLSNSVISDDFSASQHTVPDPLKTCLNVPTRTCAFEIAMKTAIEERLSIERAKVLAAVGRAMAETGKFDDARMTLNMALEEARMSKISFAVDAKMIDIAPVYAMIGDVDRAIELADSVDAKNGRDRILSLSSEMAARQGDVEGARKISEAVENRRRAIWIALKAMKLLAFNDSKQGLMEFADSLLPAVLALERPSDKLLAMARLSIIYKAGGNDDQAALLQKQTRDIGESFTSYFIQARLSASQLEFATLSGNDRAKGQAYAAAVTAEKRINSLMDKSSIADEMGSAMASAGHADVAAGYARFYKEIREKSNYLKNVAQVAGKGTNGVFTSVIKDVLEKSSEMENRYEADEVRMNLLHATRALGDLSLSRDVALAMHDDDNAAKALALLIPLL